MKCNSTSGLIALAVAYLLLSGPAQGRSATSERCPVVPGQPGWLEQQMQKREEAVYREREQAIRLLKQFLDKHPDASQRAEALFRLAELQWEHAEAGFLRQMRSYDQELEAFRKGVSPKRPEEPRIDLVKSLKIYEEILEKHPDFARSDTVLYLYGFGLNEQGDEMTALSIYRTLLKRYPKSAFVPDAHLAIGEYHFAKGKFSRARSSYERVIKHPNTPLHDLALYKTAWCYFKEGKAKQAADRFRHVLRRSREQKERQTGQVEASAAQLEKEALEDLALTFSESGGAQEAYRFMKQVGGEEYSIRVLRSLGDVFFRQARYHKAIESFRILVDRFPLAESSPQHHSKIAEAYQRGGKLELAARERLELAQRYGPGSSWAKSNASNQEAIQKANRMSEESLRFVATYRHKQAQEKGTQETYQASSRAYQSYLKQFDDSPEAPKIHFGLGEVLYKLKNYVPAAAHYTTAVKRLKDPKKKIEAAYAAVLSFDHLRQKDIQKGEPPPEEQKLVSEAPAASLRSRKDILLPGSIPPRRPAFPGPGPEPSGQ
jgi:TolA-binding protein